MPVGTQGAVKAHAAPRPRGCGAEIILGNTYHLFLRPGDELIARRGGLHRFIGWDAPDPDRQRRISGVQPGRAARRSRRRAPSSSRISTARAHLLTPERAVDIQARLGSDIAMVLDECLAYPATREEAAASMQRSVRWARRCRSRLELLRSHARRRTSTVTNSGQAQFGIVQGGVFPDLRDESADATVAIGFEGYAIGGLSVGEPIDVMYQVVERDGAPASGATSRAT